MRERKDGRRIGFRVSTVLLAASPGVMVFGKNEKRFALLLCANVTAALVLYSFWGGGVASTEGIPVQVGASNLYLGPDVVEGCIVDEVWARSTSTINVSCVEWFYLD